MFCRGLSKDDIGVARGTVFKEIWLGVGFKTGDFVKEKLGGGATVERLFTTYLGHGVVYRVFSLAGF